MEAIEQGLPAPVPSNDNEPEEDGEAGLCDRIEVWQTDGKWWTDFPPPAGFDGIEEGEPGSYGYHRELSEAELAVVEADEADERATDRGGHRSPRPAFRPRGRPSRPGSFFAPGT